MALVGSEAATQESHCQATTTIGSIHGIDGGGACIFLGIPFAAPPVGNLRWKPPRAAPSWTTPLNAVIAPALCPQINLAGALVGSEDCLKLNIWTPNPPPAGRAPVIVWLHTGGFLQTSANFAAHNGQRLAEQTGAIIVAPNYRLGPFGYLAHTLLSAEDDAYPSSGNYGFLDQRAALVWVRDHIAAFGGDPDSVTIAGTSAGSLSVSLHLVSPGSAGLFSRAIMQSGFASYLWRSSAEATSQGDDFMAALGCASAPIRWSVSEGADATMCCGPFRLARIRSWRPRVCNGVLSSTDSKFRISRDCYTSAVPSRPSPCFSARTGMRAGRSSIGAFQPASARHNTKRP